MSDRIFSFDDIGPVLVQLCQDGEYDPCVRITVETPSGVSSITQTSDNAAVVFEALDDAIVRGLAEALMRFAWWAERLQKSN